jgi:serine/threonine protein kinase
MKQRTYDEPMVAKIMMKMLRAVAFLHKNEFVHRDIKPANIMIASKDKNAELKLSDYGLGVKLTKEKKVDGWGGTLPYMAPEHFEYPLDLTNKIDVWSLGVLMYELISKDFPYNSDDEWELRMLIKL